MHPIKHKYPLSWLMDFGTLFSNILGFLLIPLTIFFILHLLIVKGWSYDIAGVLGFLVIATITGIWFVFLGNWYPEITSDIEGLHIKFLWRDLNISWHDIIDLRPVMNIGKLKNNWIIQTHSLTPFHRLYGLLSFSFNPSIIFAKSISDRDELIRRIRLAIRKNQKSLEKGLIEGEEFRRMRCGE